MKSKKAIGRTKEFKDTFNNSYYAIINKKLNNYTIYKNNKAILYQPSIYSNLYNKKTLKENAIAHIKSIMNI